MKLALGFEINSSHFKISICGGWLVCFHHSLELCTPPTYTQTHPHDRQPPETKPTQAHAICTASGNSRKLKWLGLPIVRFHWNSARHTRHTIPNNDNPENKTMQTHANCTGDLPKQFNKHNAQPNV